MTSLPLRHDKREEHHDDTAHGRGSAQSVGLPAPPAGFGLVERLGFSKAGGLDQPARLSGDLTAFGEHHIASHQLLPGA